MGTVDSLWTSAFERKRHKGGSALRDPFFDLTARVREVERRFQRRIEDFTCLNCGAEITGDGFTNHCPHCLWSRHVDVNPGDRAAACGGAMPPVAQEVKNGRTMIRHRCKTCGFERLNKLAPQDSVDALIRLARDNAARLSRGG